VSEIEEAKETFCSPVTVGWAYSEKWTLEYEARPLRKVQLGDLFGDALVR